MSRAPHRSRAAGALRARLLSSAFRYTRSGPVTFRPDIFRGAASVLCASCLYGCPARRDVRDGAAEVEHVQHVEEKHELGHDEKAEPVHAAVHAGELARAARMRVTTALEEPSAYLPIHCECDCDCVTNMP